MDATSQSTPSSRSPSPDTAIAVVTTSTTDTTTEDSSHTFSVYDGRRGTLPTISGVKTLCVILVVIAVIFFGVNYLRK